MPPTLRRFVLCRQFSSSLSYEGPPNESVANLTTIFSVTNRRWYNWRWPRTWLGDALIATAVADGVSLDAPTLRRFVLLSPILIFAELRRSAKDHDLFGHQPPYNRRRPRFWLGDALIATAVADGVSLDAHASSFCHQFSSSMSYEGLDSG